MMKMKRNLFIPVMILLTVTLSGFGMISTAAAKDAGIESLRKTGQPSGVLPSRFPPQLSLFRLKKKLNNRVTATTRSATAPSGTNFSAAFSANRPSRRIRTKLLLSVGPAARDRDSSFQLTATS